jgi:hypothetical protein
MSTQVVTITHSNDGIRVAFPGNTRVFSNPVYLAESYAIAEQQRTQIHDLLTKDVATQLNVLQKRGELESIDEIRDAVDAIRSLLIDAAKLAS